MTKNKSKAQKNKKSGTAYERNLATMKLLISDPQFKEILWEIRNYLKIQADDFLKNYNEARTWYRKLTTRSDEILDSESFIDQEKRIKQKFQQEEISRKMANKQLNLLYEKLPLNYLHNRILFIIDKFRLPVLFENNIKEYIILGKISAPGCNYSIGPYPPNKSPQKEKYVPLNIYSRLTEKEIKELKQLIDEYGKELPKYKFIENIDRNLEIEDCYKNKERVDEVESSTYKTRHSEIAENLLGNSKDGKKIYDIQRDLKTLRKRRFKFGN